MGYKMENTRFYNSIRNMLFGCLNRIVSIIFPFIVRTIFIKTLGEEYLGLNSLFSSVLQVLNLADLGFASAISASMYKPIAQGDTQKVSALLNLFRRIYKIIGMTILTVGLVLTPFIKFFISGDPPSEINIYLLWILYLTNTVVGYLLFAYRVTLLNANQRYDITERIGVITRTLISILQIIVVIEFKNMYYYVALSVSCSIIYNIWCAAECKKYFPQYSCQGQLDQALKNKITRDVKALAIQKIGNTVSLSLDSIIISAFLGLATVAVYGNYFYVITAISTFVALVYTAIMASIGNSIAVEPVEKNYRDMKKIFFLNTWLVGWCSICFMCLFQDFMTIWMGEELLFGNGIVLVLVLRFFFEQIRKVVLTYKDASGMWWLDKWRPLAGCVVNLLLNIILVKSFGIIGVAVSTIVSYALIEMPWETHVLFKYYFKRKEKEYYKVLFYNIFTLAIAGGVTYFMCEMAPLERISAIVFKMLVCIALPNMLFILFHLRDENFIESLKLLQKAKNSILHFRHLQK